MSALSIDTPYSFCWSDGMGQSNFQSDNMVELSISDNGYHVKIADNVSLDKPIILYNMASNSNIAAHTVTIGQNSHAEVIECSLGEDSNAKSDISSTIKLEANSRLKHMLLQQGKSSSNIEHLSKLSFKQGRSSTLESAIYALSCDNSRININAELVEADANCNIQHLCYAKNREQQITNITIDHASGHCQSMATTRGVFHDHAIGSFTGKLLVQPGAVKSDANLDIKNLVLSPNAEAHNKPELEIYNDDVKAKHGSSTGFLQEAELFYMQARGIPLEIAKQLLVLGFIRTVLPENKTQLAYVASILGIDLQEVEDFAAR